MCLKLTSKFSKPIAKMCHARGKYNWLLNFDQAMGHAAVAAMGRPATAPHSRGIKREIKGLLKIKD